MALRTFLTVLGRRARIVVAVFLICVAGSGLATWLATPTYTAQATLFFSVGAAESVDDLQQGGNATRAQMTSYASLVETPSVLQPVIDRLDLAETTSSLAGQVDVTAPSDTVLLEIEVTDTDAGQAARIANAVADQVITVVEDLSPTGTDAVRPAIEATVVAPAETPRKTSSPDVLLNLAAGIVLGLGLGVLAALGRDALDTRVRTATEVAALTNRPVIGNLGVDGGRQRRVAVEAAPHSPQAEEYRQLRTNLQFLDVGRRGELGDGARTSRGVLAVTSSLAAEGKSTVAVNLAVALAETSARVLLVDADLRRPSVATRLGLEGSAGLTTVLLGQAEVSDVVQEWGRTGLEVLTSGVLPPNPTELLASPAMHRLLDQLRASYDHVVIDCPPLLPVADGTILSTLVDGTIVLANATKVRRHQLAESLRNLSQVDARVLGVVLNQLDRGKDTYGYSRDAAVGAGGQATAAGRDTVPVEPGAVARAGKQPVG
ncbi:polysaccharide biosynthesis tyrosine autokinase [Geodermatophilus sp. SYSU D01105]